MNGYEVGIVVGVIAYIVFDLVGDWAQHKRLVAIEADLMRRRKDDGTVAADKPTM